MRIQEIHIHPLLGGTVDGGWPQDMEAEENLHALIALTTDDGVTGVGSCFTSGKLVDGSVQLGQDRTNTRTTTYGVQRISRPATQTLKVVVPSR